MRLNQTRARRIVGYDKAPCLIASSVKENEHDPADLYSVGGLGAPLFLCTVLRNHLNELYARIAVETNHDLVDPNIVVSRRFQ